MKRKPNEKLEPEQDLVPDKPSENKEDKPAEEEKPEPELNTPSEISETREIELNELLTEIKEKAREGTIEEEAETPIAGVWEEEKEEYEEEKETTAEDTATFLVELADMATTNICAAIAGLPMKEAEKLWSFSAKEKERLRKAAIPVLSKYGVDMPPEIVLALTLFQIEFPRIMMARQMRNQQVEEAEEPKEQTDEKNEAGTFWS